ncbi:AsmA family protein [Pseudothauera rhizosphaerae]|uniref:AsmA protein n=1 Tax=Pseudothauera rhizosphaerae TaxID=2565932 RepID=A0A4S4ADN7_9RHOO|nr:hypothetical protein [Pseudothauera rhizosphaerae]THF56882.1 hypothetical protein E6O51_18795 [Pseudothauera rhizosphaerae]
MKFLRRLALVLLLPVLLLGAAVGVLLWRGGEWLRGGVEAALQARLLPQVSVAAPAQWQVWPEGALALRGIALTGADGGRLAAVEEIAIEFAPRELLAAPPRINLVKVRGLRLRVDVDAQGRPSVLDWLLPAPSAEADGGLALPRIGRLELADAEVELEDPRRGVRLRLTLPALTAGPLAPGEAGRLELQAAAELQAPVTGVLRLAGAMAYQADERGLRLQALSAELGGELSGGWRMDGGRLTLGQAGFGTDEAVLQTLAVDAALAGPWGPVAVNAKADEAGRNAAGWRAGGTLSLAAAQFDAELRAGYGLGDGVLDGTVDGSLAGSPLAGRWSWPLGGVLDLDLAVERLDLDALRARLPPGDTEGEGGPPRWQDWPLTGEVRVGRLSVGGLESRNARLRLTGATPGR